MRTEGLFAVLAFMLLLAACQQAAVAPPAAPPPPLVSMPPAPEPPAQPAASPPSASGAAQHTGALLAGTAAPLLDFARADYDIAAASDKLIVLYFYATWCPLCSAELPHLYAAFDQLDTDDVIGFRVNYNDGDTDDDERALAKEFGVAYQHTKVFIRNGERLLKAPDTWDADRYLLEINNHLAP